MATSAPAAPSTSGAPSAPSVSPASAPTQQPAESGAPARGPLKPIPSLPGVLPDVDTSNFGVPTDAGPSSGQRARDASGRFVAGSAPATPADGGEYTQQPGDTAPEPPAEPAKPQRFKFGGAEFDTQEAAEQNFRSLRGQFRPVMALAKQVGGIENIGPTLQRAADSARAWHAEAQQLRAELEAVRSGRAPAGDPQTHQQSQDASTADPAAQADAGVDWDLYAEVRKLADAQGEPWKAEQWLIGEVQKAERARYEALIEERLSPFTAAQERAGLAQQTEQVFGALAEYQNSDGSPTFPELHNEADAYAVGKLWAALGLPPEAALTPQGAMAAIALYREHKRNSAGTAPVAHPAQPNAPTARPPVAAAPPTPSDAAGAAGLADGRPSTLGLPAEGGPSAEAARILAGLRSVNDNSSRRAVLGFDA